MVVVVMMMVVCVALRDALKEARQGTLGDVQ